MKSFLITLKTMTVVSLSFLLAVPNGNVVLAEEETEIPETVVEEAEEVSESETAEPEETAVEESEEPSEEVIAEETGESEEDGVSEEVTEEETEEPAEEIITEETTEPEEENTDGEVTEEDAGESGEEIIPEETAEPEDAVPEDLQPEELKPSEQAETDNLKTEDAGINSTIAEEAAEITPGVETYVNISTGGQYKYFKYKPSQDGVYTFSSSYSDNYVDTYGYLYDSMENEIQRNDDSGGNGQFLLFCELNANEQYYFGARLYSSSNTGSFTVILNKLNEGWNEIKIDASTRWCYVSSGKLIKNQVEVINGEPYLFDYSGYMVTNSSTEYNGKTYLIDENGHFIEYTNGWNQVGEKWYYGVDGELVKDSVIKIGNNYYGFNYDGCMYDNQEFSMYEYKDNQYEYYGYRAREGGALYVNSWYQADNYNSWWYYYGADGKGAKNITKVNGKDYLFDNFGRLLVYATREIDGVKYIGDENGYPIKVDKENGWIAVGSAWFYIENGNFVNNKVLLIGGSYYGFDDSGKMYTDTSFGMSVYDDDGSYHYYYYRAKSNGVLYKNEWYDAGHGDWYYYDSNCRRVSGVQTINGKTYVFYDWGGMYRNTIYSTGTESYVIDDKGIATKLKEGWNSVNGIYYYVDGGVILQYTVRLINGSYYGFDGMGRMYNNSTFEISGDRYCAKSGGALYVNTWVGNYYYGSDGKAYNGANTVNGVQYFFTYTGEAASNCYVLYNDSLYLTDAKCVPSKVTKDGLYRKVMNGNTGATTSYGVCVSNGKILKNEWKKIGGKWYYFNNEGFYYIGIAWIGDDVYYFNNDGTMCDSGWQKTVDGDDIYVYSGGALATGKKTINGKNYCFQNNGIMVTGLLNNNGVYELYGNNGQLIGSVKQGWNQISGTWYYFDGTEMYMGDVYTINGEKYYFDWNYMMCHDKVFNNYVFGSNGKAVKSGWAQVDTYWYYVDSSTGRIVSNQIIQIGGKKYRFDYNGRMQVNSFIYNNVAYTTDASGAITSEKTIKNGWELADGYYYYYKDGNPYNGWVDGKYYISYGRMCRNEIADGYWIGNDGVYSSKAGWINPGNRVYYEYGSGWMYAKAGGKLVEKGWEKIDGVWYYFYNYRIQTLPLKEGSKVYYFDVDGKLVKTISDPTKDQWVNAGDYWGYIKNGDPVYSGIYVIDGKEYSFSGGRMAADMLCHYYNLYGEIVYYVQSNGTVASYNGWKKVHGRWYFFDLTNGAVVYGWVSDGGKKYYIDGDGMVTGWQVIYGRLYNFGSDGALIEEVTQQNGWLQKGGNWYYFVNGQAITSNVRLIDGKVYGFNYDGRLGKNELIGGYALYYVDANGVIVKNTWKKFGNVWYYFGANGQALNGVQRINGTVYYFNGYALE